MFTKKKKTFDLHEYLLPECVVFFDEVERKDAIDKLVDRLYRSGKIHEKLLFTHALMAREKQSSTALGKGIAVPHTRSKVHEDFFLAVGIVKGNGLIWDADHPDPIHFIFLVGGPDNQPDAYLTLLAHLTGRLHETDGRGELLACKTSDQVLLKLC